MAGMLTDYRVFLRQFFRRYHTTGAILPSGRRLAAALCRYVGESDGTGPRRILEVGPGSGAVTARLVEVLRPDDHLTLVELNDEFVRHLQGRFAAEPSFSSRFEPHRIGPFSLGSTSRRRLPSTGSFPACR